MKELRVRVEGGACGSCGNNTGAEPLAVRIEAPACFIAAMTGAFLSGFCPAGKSEICKRPALSAFNGQEKNSPYAWDLYETEARYEG